MPPSPPPDPAPGSAANPAARATAHATARPAARRRRFVLLGLVPALVLALAAGGVWAGMSLHDRPFVWYNANRVAAAADRAATGSRVGTAPVVVALGGAALRHATLDEDGMAALAAKQGVERLQFLRIVHDHAQFDDFTELMPAILTAKPALVLLDVNLLFNRRGALGDLRRYATVLAGVAEGKPYLADQIALQYDKPCRPMDTSGRTDDDADRWAEATRAAVAFDPESSAYDRARRFAEEAHALGIKVALLQVRRPPGFEERLYGAANSYPPAALARLNAHPGLPLWRFPEPLHKAANYCRSGTLGPEGRRAYSAWLAAGIAQILSQPRVEEAALQ